MNKCKCFTAKDNTPCTYPARWNGMCTLHFLSLDYTPKRKKEEDTMANRNQHYQIMKPISEHVSFQEWCKDHNQRVKKKAGLSYHDKEPWVRT